MFYKSAACSDRKEMKNLVMHELVTDGETERVPAPQAAHLGQGRTIWRRGYTGLIFVDDGS